MERALRHLVQDLCPTAAAACPDLRIGPSLPPLSLATSARDFDDLDSIERTFFEFRDATRSTLHSSAAQRPLQQQQQHSRRAPQRGNHHQQPQIAPSSPLLEDMSFARCLVMLADPSVPLLSPADAERCLAGFVERATSQLAREADAVARAYAEHGGGGKKADVLESLSDPVACLSDSGLNDAAVLHLARTLRVALVVRRGGAGSACVVFPPRAPEPARPSDAAALIDWRDGAFALVDAIDVLSDAQDWLLTERDGELARRICAMAPLDRQKVPALAEAAALAAVVACPSGAGGGRVTKAHLVVALDAARVRIQPLSVFSAASQ